MLHAWVRVREKVPQAVYLIVGDGDDRLRLQALALELGLGESVCFAGAVSEDVLAACYKACEVFICYAGTNGAGPPGAPGRRIRHRFLRSHDARQASHRR